MADNLRKYKSLYSSTASTFSTGTGVTITPASVVGLPTDTEITLTFDRVDSSGAATASKMERIIGTISGGNFVVRTSPASGRGADSSTEQTHTSPVVEMIWNAKDWNDTVDWALTEHNQDGTHDTTKVVDLTTAQTLTNKTLTSPTISSPTITGTETSPKIQGAASNAQFPQVIGEYDNGNSGTAQTIDASKGDRQLSTVTGNVTYTFSNFVKGQSVILRIVEDGTGSHTITLPTVKWPGGTAGTFTTTASAINLLVIYYDGTNYLCQLAAGFA